MLTKTINTSLALDVSTLLVAATCVTALLGLFLLLSWTQDRIRALAWWGAAYLMGSFATGLWAVTGENPAFMPDGFLNALLFVACGMTWSAARLFHGRRILWLGMLAGASVWLAASQFQSFMSTDLQRIILGSIIVSAYTFLIAIELWSERRKTLTRHWPAIFVPMMHGLVFLLPIVLASLLTDEHGLVHLTSAWMAVYALVALAYTVGTALIVLTLAKERVVRIHKTAAATDPLTGLLNRRALMEGADLMVAQLVRRKKPLSVLMFDLDHFKKINDNFGHAIGDAALRQFAETVVANMRTTDLVGRLGGEEFVAVLPGATAADAMLVSERMRSAFELAGREICGCPVGATVSIGIACGQSTVDVFELLARADLAMYQAKKEGRNRIVVAPEDVSPAEQVVPTVVPMPMARRLVMAAKRVAAPDPIMEIAIPLRAAA